MTKHQKTAVAYVRLSKDEEKRSKGNGLSARYQEEKIRAWAELKDLQITEVIADIGFSARNLRRPGMQKLVRMIKEGEVDAVIAYRLDRLFRSTIDALKMRELFEKKRVALQSISETLDTDSAVGRYFFSILAATTTFERELIGERTSHALQSKKKHGEVYGQVPFGFKRYGDKLREDPEQQEVLKGIIDAGKEGWSPYTIAKRLNDEGVPSKTGKKWSAQTVRNILKREGVM